MPNILFVCVGNEERSQMAEGYYNHLTKSKDAKSAGVWAWRAGFFSKPSKNAIAVMKEDGINISRQKIKQLNQKMVEEADRIIVLCTPNFCVDFPYLTQSAKTTFITVSDPIGSDISFTRQVRNQIKKVVNTVLKT